MLTNFCIVEPTQTYFEMVFRKMLKQFTVAGTNPDVRKNFLFN